MSRKSLIKSTAIWIISFCLLVSFSMVARSEEIENFKPKLSIRLTGGLCYMNVGDLNTYLRSFDNYLFINLNTYTYYYKGGEIGKINNYGYDFCGELRLDISSKFALGIGMGFMSRKSRSDFQTVGFFPFQTPFPLAELCMHNFILEPKLKTFPLRVGIYYTLHFSSKINLFLNSGLDYYFSKVYLYKYHWFNELLTMAPPAERYETYNVNSNFFGYHGGIGFEYYLLSNMFLVLEIQGKYAKSENLKGTREYYYEGIGNGREEGILYFGKRDLTDIAYGNNCPDLIISPSRPTGDEFKEIRKAVLDFSGVSVMFGIRIKLF